MVLKHISTSRMIADPLTNPIARETNQAHVRSLGLCKLWFYLCFTCSSWPICIRYLLLMIYDIILFFFRFIFMSLSLFWSNIYPLAHTQNYDWVFMIESMQIGNDRLSRKRDRLWCLESEQRWDTASLWRWVSELCYVHWSVVLERAKMRSLKIEYGWIMRSHSPY